MSYQYLTVEREDNIGIITLNRPPANPISYPVMAEIGNAVDELQKDKAIKAIIITGAGEKAFSAGFDVKTAGTPESAQLPGKGHEVFNKIEGGPKPVIAAINGFALGGGCELAMACHFRFMVDAEGAVIGLPEITLGIIPGWGGTQRMPRLIGKTKALEMLLTGKRLRAPEALSIGLINKVSKPGEVLKDAKDLGKELAKKAPLAVKAILDSVFRGLNSTFEEGLKIELEGSRLVGQSKDAVEGITAFLQKREAVFTGE
ncbi:MAG: enoyl-CoA hydratase [Chloroflexi bacterium]|nr:enoyl-CoA hydratase [Chloroflexota bacterium]MBM3183042.1 enoyl-CoA hydratase [Chloroflexota bacterium]MBM4452679.1 enoyl-CoA hydratase [Chloroflexota bacterium]